MTASPALRLLTTLEREVLLGIQCILDYVSGPIFHSVFGQHVIQEGEEEGKGPMASYIPVLRDSGDSSGVAEAATDDLGVLESPLSTRGANGAPLSALAQLHAACRCHLEPHESHGAWYRTRWGDSTTLHTVSYLPSLSLPLPVCP